MNQLAVSPCNDCGRSIGLWALCCHACGTLAPLGALNDRPCRLRALARSIRRFATLARRFR